jgi:hypothetical protein
MYQDVRDRSRRSIVESVQSDPAGALFVDASVGQRFYPENSATRLLAAVVLVRATDLQHLLSTSTLPVGILDASAIPAEYRPYVAVALRKNLLTLNNSRFEPSRPLTRIELAQALNTIVGH